MADVEVGELPPVEEGVMRLSHWDHRRPGGACVGSNPGEESKVRSVQSGEITSLPVNETVAVGVDIDVVVIVVPIIVGGGVTECGAGRAVVSHA